MSQTARIPALDLIRSAAVLGMIAFHFSYDLLMFGILPPTYAGTSFFYFHARIVASTFLCLAGLGLWLSHQNGIRWPAFTRRLAIIAGAAGLVSLATYFALPEAYIYFGILHAIALYSLIGLAFLRLPAVLTLAVAAVLIWGSFALPDLAFNAPLLRFLGLATLPAYTVDFEPIFPWLAAPLIGIALGRIGSRIGVWQGLTRPATPLMHALGWPGRHSLAIYLIHQPVLFGLVWAYAQL